MREKRFYWNELLYLILLQEDEENEPKKGKQAKIPESPKTAPKKQNSPKSQTATSSTVSAPPRKQASPAKVPASPKKSPAKTTKVCLIYSHIY